MLYADDAALIVSDRNMHFIEQKLESELEQICNWLVDNKLSIHLGKTESILFGSVKRLKPNKYLAIHCKGTSIAAKSEIRYLGLCLNQNCNGNNTAAKVISKCNSKLKFLYRNCKTLPFKVKKTNCFCTDQTSFRLCVILLVYWYY